MVNGEKQTHMADWMIASLAKKQSNTNATKRHKGSAFQFSTCAYFVSFVFKGRFDFQAQLSNAPG
ncbi:MAG: hypothetical protein Fur0016_23590 [Anaerolineales bacterium]